MKEQTENLWLSVMLACVSGGGNSNFQEAE